MRGIFVTVGMATVALSCLMGPRALAQLRAPTPSHAGLDATLEARRVRMLGQLKPAVRAKLDGPTKGVLAEAVSLGDRDLFGIAKAKTAPISGGSDISEVAFVVLMQSASSVQTDLEQLNTQAQAIHRQKAAVRAALAARASARATGKSCLDLGCINGIQPTADFTKTDIDALVSQVQPKPDAQRDEAMNAMSQHLQQDSQLTKSKLQTLQDVLSTIMKSISVTQSSIAQDIKT